MGILLDLVNIEKLFPRPLSCVCIVGAPRRAIDRVAFREIESHEIDFFEPQDRRSYFVCTLPRSKKLSGEYLSFIFSGLTCIFC